LLVAKGVAEMLEIVECIVAAAGLTGAALLFIEVMLCVFGDGSLNDF